jgi:hypothetical protein
LKEYHLLDYKEINLKSKAICEEFVILFQNQLLMEARQRKDSGELDSRVNLGQ